MYLEDNDVFNIFTKPTKLYRGNKTMLVRKSTVRKYIMGVVERSRPGIITKVDSEVYSYLDAKLRKIIVAMIHEHPSGFKTLKP